MSLNSSAAYVFGLLRERGPALIATILHKRMDWMTRRLVTPEDQR
jgi:plasmid stabilization system protein ParE